MLVALFTIRCSPCNIASTMERKAGVEDDQINHLLLNCIRSHQPHMVRRSVRQAGRQQWGRLLSRRDVLAAQMPEPAAGLGSCSLVRSSVSGAAGTWRPGNQLKEPMMVFFYLALGSALQKSGRLLEWR